jgi:Fe-S oxidoreductase
LEKYPQAVVVADDSSCATHLKEYPGLFDPGTPWRTRAEALAARVRDLSRWLAEKRDIFPSGATDPVTVAYHDPCKARQGSGIWREPRAILDSLPGVTRREVPEAEQCCGGGGAAGFENPEMSRAVLDRKTAAILSTGAERVVTSSVSCLWQLRFGLRRVKSGVTALSLADFLAGRFDPK